MRLLACISVVCGLVAACSLDATVEQLDSASATNNVGRDSLALGGFFSRGFRAELTRLRVVAQQEGIEQSAIDRVVAGYAERRFAQLSDAIAAGTPLTDFIHFPERGESVNVLAEFTRELGLMQLAKRPIDSARFTLDERAVIPAQVGRMLEKHNLFLGHQAEAVYKLAMPEAAENAKAVVRKAMSVADALAILRDQELELDAHRRDYITHLVRPRVAKPSLPTQ